MAKQRVEPSNPQDTIAIPLEDMKQKALEASGTGVLHWENMGLHKLPGKDLPISQHVTWLKLYNNGLTEFPDEVLGIWRLESLEINANLIKSIPDSITQLSMLRMLHMQHNHVHQLPPAIGGLTKLTSLYVHGNRLKELPLELSLCTKRASCAPRSCSTVPAPGNNTAFRR